MIAAPGQIIKTSYVRTRDVVMQASDGHHLLPAEVERAYRRQLELGDQQDALPGYWDDWDDGGWFVLTDGRNRYVARLMLGFEHILVAWTDAE